MLIDEAIASIDRKRFLPSDFVDTDPNVAVPFGPNQTVPTAAITRLLVELAELKATDVVLEIGTGSGYQAAIMARIAKEVHTVEVRDIPHDLIDKLPPNVFMYHRDGLLDPPAREFDKIVVTCGVPYLVSTWYSILKNGGIVIVPLLSGEVVKYVKYGGVMQDKGPFAYADFVPFCSPSGIGVARADCE